MCLTNIKCLKNLVVVKQASKDRLMSGKQCQSFSPGLKGRERVGRNDTVCGAEYGRLRQVFPWTFKM